MADTGDPGASSSTPGPSFPKAIGSLAKKPSDVTRQGSQKLKFVPTLPARRKKEDVKQEAPPPTIPSGSPDRGRGRGRKRGRGGEGRGAAPRPPPVEMTASGPFAMGPALAGTSARRTAPRSNFAPIVPLGPGNAAALGAGLSGTAGPSLKREKETLHANDTAQKEMKKDDDDDVYSDPDEGVDIIDMENVRQMDWMAPDSLRKERKEQKKVVHVKKEDPASPLGLKKKEEAMDIEEVAASGEVDLANALDLSESEEEEELEDLMADFSLQVEAERDADVRQGRLYFFQFPEPFPTFVSNIPSADPTTMSVDTPPMDSHQRKVSFAPNVKPPGPGGDPTSASAGSQVEQMKELPKVDGIIGELEVYRSGAVKMRFGNGIVMDVIGATQPSFLQQAVHVNMEKKRLQVIGEINKRFVVSPDLDTLLHAMELRDQAEANTMSIDDTNLIRMDS